MDFTIKEYHFPSHSGLCDIYAKRVTLKEDIKPKAVVQISHGMAEYSERYMRFAKALCEAGFVVFMSDHVGHGKSIKDTSMLGFFGETNGEQTWVEDLKSVQEIIEKEYPTLPLFLFGHGMGSLIARNYTAQYGKLFKGVVYTGTNGSNPALSFGLCLSSLLTKICGAKHKSKLLDRMAFGAYNKKTPKETPCDWVSRDKVEVQKFMDDALCGYMYSVSGLHALFQTVKIVTAKTWYAKVPKDLPILLLSGSMDPIGNYGKGVDETFQKLKASGHEKVEEKLYKDARHEILNETNQEEVTSDILHWLKAQL